LLEAAGKWMGMYDMYQIIFLLRLFTPQMDLIEVNGETLTDMSSDELVSKDSGLFVNGDSLGEILDNKIHLKKFMRLTRQCKAVVISRCCHHHNIGPSGAVQTVSSKAP
jgi:hypothetical protein